MMNHWSIWTMLRRHKTTSSTGNNQPLLWAGQCQCSPWGSYLAERATASYEAARETIRKFINAGSTKKFSSPEERQPVLNWVARFAEEILTEGDQVLISVMEHHSNIIPWQEVCP